MRRTDDYDFELPAELVAQAPADRRDKSRLLVVGQDPSRSADMRFSDLVSVLPEGAVIVANDARVRPARLRCHKRESGGAVELLLLEPTASGWRALARASKPIREGAVLSTASGAEIRVVSARAADGSITVELPESADDLCERDGELPLPPYIRRPEGPDAGDSERYQTVYAREVGAIAAPTAGLHLTAALIDQIRESGREWATLTLHVGLGTFAPIRAGELDDIELHAERYDIPERTAELVASGRPVVAIGTTVVRALEAAAASGERSGETRLFISPGFRFNAATHLVTNFHLPRSSLLMMVCAFAGYARVMETYRQAVTRGYRFYSYGDAMLLARGALVTASGFSFEVLATRGKARAGVLHTPRGDIPTPVFMPVGTLGAVKAVTMREVAAPPIDAKVILGNTYHLYLRPGLDVIEAHEGLHRFCNWERPILTDSGGYQVFSLAKNGKLAKIDDDGVTFRSHIDGSKHRLTPERSMEIQGVLGSDIAMVFDQCPPAESHVREHEQAMARTTAWAHRCLAVERPAGQALFGIVQGGTHIDLRERHLAELAALPFDGLALGGLSVGDTPEEMYRILDAIAHAMPADRPRYLMGVGTPADLRRGVAAGIDMFDCVMPTRNARTGSLFTAEGRLIISHARYRADTAPLDPDCPCETCQTASRAYLRHLYMAKEVTYNHLATLHNLTHYAGLMAGLRAEILNG